MKSKENRFNCQKNEMKGKENGRQKKELATASR